MFGSQLIVSHIGRCAILECGFASAFVWSSDLTYLLSSVFDRSVLVSQFGFTILTIVYHTPQQHFPSPWLPDDLLAKAPIRLDKMVTRFFNLPIYLTKAAHHRVEVRKLRSTATLPQPQLNYWRI